MSATVRAVLVLGSLTLSSAAPRAQAPPDPAEVKAAFGNILKSYAPASRQITLRFDFDSQDELKFFDLRRLEQSSGSARCEKGLLLLKNEATGGGDTYYFAALMPRELHFDRIMQLRMVCQDTNITKASPGLVFNASEDGDKGYRVFLLHESGTLQLMRMDGADEFKKLDVKPGKVESGDQIELSARCGEGKISLSVKGAKTRPRVLDAVDTTFKSGRAGVMVVVQSAEELKVDSVEIQGVVTATSLRRLLDTLKVVASTAKDAEAPKTGEKAAADKAGKAEETESGDEDFADAIDLATAKELSAKAKELFASAMKANGMDKRRELMRRVVTEAPSFTAGWLLLGLYGLFVEDYVVARTDLTKALELDPASLIAHKLLADLGFAVNDPALTKAHAEAAVKLAPENPIALSLRARVRLGAGDRKGAREDAEKAVAAKTDKATRKTCEQVIAVCNGPTWLRGPFEVKTEHYLVLSDVSKELSTKIGTRLEEAYELFGKHFRKAPAGHLPGRTLVFQSKESYLAYAKKTMGTDLESTLGVYFPGCREFLLFCREETDETRQVLVHEGFHQYLHHFIENAPHWFNEGMASYFEATKFSAAGAKVGGPLKMRVETLKSDEYVSRDLKDLMLLSAEQFMDPSRVSGHYAQAWAFCNFLREKPGLGRDTFRVYVEQILKGKSAKEAFDASFGLLSRAKWDEINIGYGAHLKTLKGD